MGFKYGKQKNEFWYIVWVLLSFILTFYTHKFSQKSKLPSEMKYHRANKLTVEEHFYKKLYSCTIFLFFSFKVVMFYIHLRKL